MPTYIVKTERQDINGRENWHVNITNESGDALTDSDGDTEVECVAIALCMLNGDKLPDLIGTVT